MKNKIICNRNIFSRLRICWSHSYRPSPLMVISTEPNLKTRSYLNPLEVDVKSLHGVLIERQNGSLEVEHPVLFIWLRTYLRYLTIVECKSERARKYIVWEFQTVDWFLSFLYCVVDCGFSLATLVARKFYRRRISHLQKFG